MTGKFFIFVFIILTLVSINFAQAENRPNIADQAAQITEFEVNGLKVIIKRRSSAQTVSGGLFIRGGARNISEKDAGIESLMLSSAVEAGKSFPRQTVRREISRTGSGIIPSAGNDYSAISLITTRPNFDRVWNIFADVLLNPTFAEDTVKTNRELILTGLREREISPEGALEAGLDRAIYAGHPYANEVGGTAANISRFTAADLRAYHQKVMQTSRLLLVFVGDLNPEEMKTRIAASFGKLPRGDYKEAAYPALNFSKPTLEIISRPNLPTNYVKGVFNAPSLDNPDYYAMRVAMSILGSLVVQEVRTARQLSYAPDASLENFAANTANISVTANDANQSIALMLEQINLLRTRTLRDEGISEVTANFLTSYYLGQETNAAQAGELARYELIGGGWRNSLVFLDKISKVSAKDVQAVSEKYMKNIRFVVVGNPAAVNRAVFVDAQTN